MPLYEYACRACGERFEKMARVAQRFDAPACPACGETDATLALSVPGMVGAATTGGAASPDADFDCGAPGGCFGGGCSLN